MHAIGTPESASLWVHVGDRGADRFPFFRACRSTQTHLLLRAGKSRRIQQSEEEISHELPQARAFPSQASRPFEGPARQGRQARSTQLQLAFGQMTLLPPRHEPRASKQPLTRWVIRVWEEQARDAEESLEWVLLTSVPTTTLPQAWERVDWDGYRWLAERVQPQRTQTQRLTARGGGDHRADLPLLLGHADAIKQPLDHGPHLLKGGLGKSLLDSLAKGFH